MTQAITPLDPTRPPWEELVSRGLELKRLRRQARWAFCRLLDELATAYGAAAFRGFAQEMGEPSLASAVKRYTLYRRIWQVLGTWYQSHGDVRIPEAIAFSVYEFAVRHPEPIVFVEEAVSNLWDTKAARVKLYGLAAVTGACLTIRFRIVEEAQRKRIMTWVQACEAQLDAWIRQGWVAR